MREELAALCRRLQEETGARPFVLPPPFSRGHFRLYGAKPVQDADFLARVEGANTFVTISDAAQTRILLEMEERTPRVDVLPERSPMDTLLYQILAHGFSLGGEDAPRLCRLCLELDDDPRRAGRAIERLMAVMGAMYAECLREGRKFSMLPAAARQVVWYRQIHSTKKGGN